MKATETDPPIINVILSMIRQHPCTIRQIADHCSSDSYEIVKYLSAMSRQGKIIVRYINGQVIVSGNDLINACVRPSEPGSTGDDRRRQVHFNPTTTSNKGEAQWQRSKKHRPRERKSKSAHRDRPTRN